MTVDATTTRRIPLSAGIAFPAPEDWLHDFYIEKFRADRVVLGKSGNGGWLVWDLNKTPHALIADRSGDGKTALINILLYLGLCNSDVCDTVIVDMKREFLWARGFQGVRFADDESAATEIITELHTEMGTRLRLFHKRGVQSLDELRELYALHPRYLAEDGGSLPRRTTLLLDDMNHLLTACRASDRATVTSVGSLLMRIAVQSRAVGINLVICGQSVPFGEVPPLLSEIRGIRICLGDSDEYTWNALFGPERRLSAPPVLRGRGWVTAAGSRVQELQIPYLPGTTWSAPWNSGVTVVGAAERLRYPPQNEMGRRLSRSAYVGHNESPWDATDAPDSTDGDAESMLLAGGYLQLGIGPAHDRRGGTRSRFWDYATHPNILITGPTGLGRTAFLTGLQRTLSRHDRVVEVISYQPPEPRPRVQAPNVHIEATPDAAIEKALATMRRRELGYAESTEPSHVFVILDDPFSDWQSPLRTEIAELLMHSREARMSVCLSLPAAFVATEQSSVVNNLCSVGLVLGALSDSISQRLFSDHPAVMSNVGGSMVSEYGWLGHIGGVPRRIYPINNGGQ